MRRQTATSGINPAGSSRALRLDPLSLPVSFDAHDIRARWRRAADRTSSRTRRAAPCRPRHADGDQRSRQRFSRRRAARHRRCADAGAGASRPVADRFRSASAPIATRSPTAWQMWSEIFALPQLQDEARASPRRGAAAATRSAPAGRNSWCAAAPAICSIRRTSIAASARSSRGIELMQGGQSEACPPCIDREMVGTRMRLASRYAPASPHRPASPQTAAAPRRGWT